MDGFDIGDLDFDFSLELTVEIDGHPEDAPGDVNCDDIEGAGELAGILPGGLSGPDIPPDPFAADDATPVTFEAWRT